MRLCSLSLFVLTLGLIEGAPAPFVIVSAGIHQSEDGPLVPAGTTFTPGESLFFSFRLEGFKVAPPKNHVRISYKIDAFDPKGVRLMETVESSIDSDLAPEDTEWKPKARLDILIPPFAGSGTYKIGVTAKDEQSNATAEKEIAFVVHGHEVEPSETLALRNFRFYRLEEDPEPLAIAAYRPGDTLWAKFDIIGFKLGEKNQIHVDYGVSVLGPSGKALFTREEAATEQGFSFYPQRYVPGVMNLSLQASIRPGEYAIVITARDRVGQQTSELKQTFKVE